MTGLASNLTRFFASLLLLAAATRSAMAAPPVPPPSQQLYTYIMVLRDPRQVPGHEKDPHPKLVDPDVKGLGGEIEESWSTRRVVRLPQAAADALANNPYVKYLQPIDTGSGLPPKPRLTSSSQKDLTPVTASTPPRWYSGDYRYDGSGNITDIGFGTGATLNSDNKANAYAYDGLGRLTSATVNDDGGNNTETYTYDSFGNLRQRTTNGQSSMFININTGNNRIVGYGYDAAGNQSSDNYTYGWFDSESRLREVMTATGYAAAMIYDADDERIAVSPNLASFHWTIRDFDGKILREFESSGSQESNAWLWVEDSIYREDQLVAADRVDEEGGRRHFHTDHLGTPRLITSQSSDPAKNGIRYAAHDYYPFGTEVTDLRQEMTEHDFDRPEPRKFTSHERDFIGGTELNNTVYLDSMHARMYNPNLGRFLSVDPSLDLKRTLSHPQMWNRYAYVTDNPLRYTDPDGRDMTFGDYASAVWEATKQTADDVAYDTAEPALIVMSGFIKDSPKDVAIGSGMIFVDGASGAIGQKLVEGISLGFTSRANLLRHFEKHGAEFGFKIAEQYGTAASRFAATAGSEGVDAITTKTGEKLIYNASTKEFAVVNKGGEVVTYFKANAKYWAKQVAKVTKDIAEAAAQ
jgi:RHS repeat-associated protein